MRHIDELSQGGRDGRGLSFSRCHERIVVRERLGWAVRNCCTQGGMTMELSYRKISAAVLLCAMALPCRCDEGLLIANVAGIEDSDAVLNLVAQAFSGRGWTVKAKDHQAVAAELRGVEMQISISGPSLIFHDNAKSAQQHAGPSGVPPPPQAILATRWRANVEKDLRILLAQRQFQNVPADRNGATTLAASVADRLKALESLKASGAITEAEYAKKRAEIIDAL